MHLLERCEDTQENHGELSSNNKLPMFTQLEHDSIRFEPKSMSFEHESSILKYQETKHEGQLKFCGSENPALPVVLEKGEPKRLPTSLYCQHWLRISPF